MKKSDNRPYSAEWLAAFQTWPRLKRSDFLKVITGMQAEITRLNEEIERVRGGKLF